MLKASSFTIKDLLGEKAQLPKDAIIGRGQAQSLENGEAIRPSGASCGARYQAGEASARGEARSDHGKQELDKKER